jgi:hypothetical protein
MIQRSLNILFLLAIPVVLLGREAGKRRYIFKPVIPDSIQGIQIQFEAKRIELPAGESMVSVY